MSGKWREGVPELQGTAMLRCEQGWAIIVGQSAQPRGMTGLAGLKQVHGRPLAPQVPGGEAHGPAEKGKSKDRGRQ
eukprot:10034138-Alexandrium_andersonii.AAC.1